MSRRRRPEVDKVLTMVTVVVKQECLSPDAELPPKPHWLVGMLLSSRWQGTKEAEPREVAGPWPRRKTSSLKKQFYLEQEKSVSSSLDSHGAAGT